MDAGDVRENPVTGMHLTIIETPEETDGRRVVVEYRLRPGTGRDYTLAHVHRRYVERFDILSGRAAYMLGGAAGTAVAGETVIVPLGTSHIHPWSVGDEPLVVRQTTEAPTPDVAGLRNTLIAAEATFELARRGKTDANGQPRILPGAVIFHELLLPHSHAAGLPYGAQRVIFGLLAVVGRALGYRAIYSSEPLAKAATAESSSNRIT